MLGWWSRERAGWLCVFDKNAPPSHHIFTSFSSSFSPPITSHILHIKLTNETLPSKKKDPETPNQILVFERYTGGGKALKEHGARPSHIMMTDYMLKKKVAGCSVLCASIRSASYSSIQDGRGTGRFAPDSRSRAACWHK